MFSALLPLSVIVFGFAMFANLPSTKVALPIKVKEPVTKAAKLTPKEELAKLENKFI